MPSAKRRRSVAADEPPELQKVVEDDVAAKCAIVAQALGRAIQLPQACRDMLAAGTDVSLGVPCGQRDSRQADFARFIGEALSEVEATLATDVEAAELAARPSVAAAEEAVAAASSQLAVAKACLLEAHEALLCSQAELQAADAKVAAATSAAQQAEAARSYGEGDLLVCELERDLCQAGSVFLSTGSCSHASASSTAKPEVDVPALQKVASKLGLEDSLLHMLPIVARKPLESRSFLEKAAAEMLSAALSKHAVALEERLGNSANAVSERDAAAEATRAALREAEEERARTASATAESQAEHSVRQGALDRESKNVARCRGELEAARRPIKAAQQELERFQSGPLAAYYELLAHDEVARCEKVLQASGGVAIAELGA